MANIDYLSKLGERRQRNTQAIREQLLSETELRTDIRIDLVDPNPFQPRESFDKVEDMAKSMREHGQYYPILVRQVGTRYQVADGETRLRAAALNRDQFQGPDTLGAVIKTYTDEQMALIAYRTAYERKSLDPLEEARGIKRLMASFKWTYAKLSQELNKPEHHFLERTRLLNLPEELQELVKEGKLGPSRAVNLGAIKDEATRLQLTQEVIEHDLTVQDIRERKKALDIKAKVPTAEAEKAQWRAFKAAWDHLTLVQRQQLLERAQRLAEKNG